MSSVSSVSSVRRGPDRRPYSVKEEAIFCVDRTLRVIAWGKGMSELTGRGEGDALGKKYHEILPRLVDGEGDVMNAVLDGKKELRLKGHVFRCFNSQVRADFTLEAIGDGNGGVSGVKITVDSQSTCGVATQLHNSQWLIDIGKTATTLAHGVRNPLNAIKGAVIFLRERYAEEETLAEFAGIIEEEIARLDHFISTFLSTSMSDLDLAETDVNDVMRRIEIISVMQAQLGDVDVSFDYGDIPAVKTSAFHLEQAVLNVINNAIEAT